MGLAERETRMPKLVALTAEAKARIAADFIVAFDAVVDTTCWEYWSGVLRYWRLAGVILLLLLLLLIFGTAIKAANKDYLYLSRQGQKQ